MSNCFDRGCNGCEACIEPETQAPDPAPKAELVDALEDALSVCRSVDRSKGRTVEHSGCTMHLQTAEWCAWLETEVGPKVEKALALVKSQAPEGTQAQWNDDRMVELKMLRQRVAMQRYELARLKGPNGKGAPAPQAAPDEVLVAIKRGDGYQDVHPELVAADALGNTPFEWRVIDTAPQTKEPANDR